MSGAARIGVVVVNYASADLIATNLAGLADGDVVVEVVVVDNRSTSEERRRVGALATERGWHLLTPGTNLGFGVGANLGVEAAFALGLDVVCLLNPDARISAADLETLAARALAEPDTLRAPRVVTEEGRDWFTGGRIDLRAGTTPKATLSDDPAAGPYWLSGACLVFTAAAWARTGGFAPDFFLYWEDVDLSWRHVAAGGRLAYDGDLTVVHAVGGSQRDEARLGRGRSPLYYRYNCRNRLLFAARHLDARTRLRWALSAPRYAREVLLRGGRRQLLRPWAPLSALVRGTLAGWGALLARSPARSGRSARSAPSAPSAPSVESGTVRVYRSLRTAHLERFAELEPATVFYRHRNYDFDATLLEGLDVHQVDGALDLALRLLRRDVATLEVNEPLMLAATRTSLAAVAAVRLRGAVRRRRTRVVAYAIENLDPFATAQTRVRRRARRSAHRIATRLLVGALDRLAFGTEAAARTYRPWLHGPRPETAVIPALSTPCPTCPSSGGPQQGERAGVVFLGAFDERKGLRQLLAAWPTVGDLAPEATLRLLGKGALEPLARAAAATDPRVTLAVDPSRVEIHAALAGARVVVLLSQPSPTWREQVGLPIVEALAHGCEIVTTAETGLASWLHDHGHRLVAADAAPGDLAATIAEALASARGPAEITADLPAVDGRLAADRWLQERGEAPRGTVRRRRTEAVSAAR
ncbi:glycosyltransferase [Nocardioides sp.]|uniref:glycosyltransferase n=1 Tax=Nocardioides sp. TaxID=35761 RepID=UPI00261C5AA0|nr:glycosyltransferase [Nocardioides sp.]